MILWVVREYMDLITSEDVDSDEKRTTLDIVGIYSTAEKAEQVLRENKRYFFTVYDLDVTLPSPHIRRLPKWLIQQ